MTDTTTTTRPALAQLMAQGREPEWAVNQLTDICQGSKPEIRVLREAINHIARYDQTVNATSTVLNGIANSLAQETARSTDQCLWAAETWAIALGKMAASAATTPTVMPLANSSLRPTRQNQFVPVSPPAQPGSGTMLKTNAPGKKAANNAPGNNTSGNATTTNSGGVTLPPSVNGSTPPTWNSIPPTPPVKSHASGMAGGVAFLFCVGMALTGLSAMSAKNRAESEKTKTVIPVVAASTSEKASTTATKTSVPIPPDTATVIKTSRGIADEIPTSTVSPSAKSTSDTPAISKASDHNPFDTSPPTPGESSPGKIPAPMTATKAEESIRQRYEEWTSAFNKQDSEGVMRMLAPNYVCTNLDGSTTHYKGEKEDNSKTFGSLTKVTYHTPSVSDVRLESGDHARCAVDLTLDKQQPDGQQSTTHISETAHWRYTGSEWLCETVTVNKRKTEGEEVGSLRAMLFTVPRGWYFAKRAVNTDIDDYTEYQSYHCETSGFAMSVNVMPDYGKQDAFEVKVANKIKQGRRKDDVSELVSTSATLGGKSAFRFQYIKSNGQMGIVLGTVSGGRGYYVGLSCRNDSDVQALRDFDSLCRNIKFKEE